MKRLGGIVSCSCLVTVLPICLIIILVVVILASIQAYITAVYESYMDGEEAPPSIHGMPATGYITATYHDEDYYEQFGVQHNGIDIANSARPPVYCTIDRARVVKAGWDTSGYGYYVKLQDIQTGWYTLYAHLDRIDVSTGDTVQWGGQIGKMGRSGNSTGVHLHYEIRRPDNSWIDPEDSEDCCD